MWEGDCQVVCVNNKEIIGLFSQRLSLQWPWGPCWGWAGRGPGITHNYANKGGQTGRQGRSQACHSCEGCLCTPG